MIKPYDLSSTARDILAAAVEHEARLARAPQRLPAAARNAVLRNLIGAGLVEECRAAAGYVDLGWRRDKPGTRMAPRITETGIQMVSAEAPAIATIPTQPRGETLTPSTARAVDASTAATEIPGNYSAGP